MHATGPIEGVGDGEVVGEPVALVLILEVMLALTASVAVTERDGVGDSEALAEIEGVTVGLALTVRDALPERVPLALCDDETVVATDIETDSEGVGEMVGEIVAEMDSLRVTLTVSDTEDVRDRVGERLGEAIRELVTVAERLRDGDLLDVSDGVAYTLAEIDAVYEALTLSEALGEAVVAGAMQQAGSVSGQGLLAKPPAILATQLSLPSTKEGNPGAHRLALLLM